MVKGIALVTRTGRDHIQRSPTQSLGFRCQSSPLIILQPKGTSLHLLLQDAVLFDEVRDHVRLMPVHPARYGEEERLQRVDLGSHGPF